MVEVLVLDEPGDTGVVLTIVFEGLVNWVEILRTSHGGNPSMGWVIDWSIVNGNSNWEPSLLHFRVHLFGAFEISVDSGKDSFSKLTCTHELPQGIMEDNLQVRVVGFVVLIVLRAGRTSE